MSRPTPQANERRHRTDNDPLGLAHARALLTSTPAGRTACIHADLHDPAVLLADPAVTEVLDFSQPVGLMLVSVLPFWSPPTPRQSMTGPEWRRVRTAAPGPQTVAVNSGHRRRSHGPAPRSLSLARIWSASAAWRPSKIARASSQNLRASSGFPAAWLVSPRWPRVSPTPQ
jgi:hypothetical protein